MNATSWTARLRTRIATLVPPGQALPDRQPVYVASWIYVFGVLTLAALVVVLITGGLLALGGPTWWRTSGTGHFVNSLHLWSNEIFFAVMVVHLWGKFFMAAWRGRPASSPSWARSAPRSPATSPRPTSTPNGSAPRPRTG